MFAAARRNELGSYGPRVTLLEKLSASHARIEQCFLKAGETLVSVMEIVGALVSALDQFTSSLGGDAIKDTIADLRKSVADLASLPETAAARQKAFDDIAQLCAQTVLQVEDMRETFRYLRTFAISVKITGAGIDEFAGFADEIRERIQSGAREIDSFAQQLGAMNGELGKAKNFADGVLSDFQATIPAIIASLDRSALLLAQERKEMSAIADDVRHTANQVQSKIASVLSALQIGDITRQRIEHVRDSFKITEEFTASTDGRSLTPEERWDIERAVFALAVAQIDQMLEDFREKSASISSIIASFAQDATQMLSQRERLGSFSANADKNVLKAMERDIGHASTLAVDIQARGSESDKLVARVSESVQALLSGIDVVRGIKTDIHYMALNSNLRCSRLGDAGRAVNVVSGELRTFAGRLEDPANAVMAGMQAVKAVAGSLLVTHEDGRAHDVVLPLPEALEAIKAASQSMDAGLRDVTEQGGAVFGRIMAAVKSLDFESQLGAVLADSADIARKVMEQQGVPDQLPPVAEIVGGRIFAIYTMVQERQIHIAILPGSTLEAAAEAPAAQSDDDFLEDALF
ncbi:hypothetical protein BTR14_15465 [Rhizobium rhizosphaerae]|uniref:Methyl-accepting transducer domain-containing protein n=1 Tax=Xaviernesmea rhizosphaerae TaxID=1672749 RepID=A0ABX3PC29_9HYPH|nr:hypothetical protein BTR14_15465 [Xaviernesmea rhizosphaerae]